MIAQNSKIPDRKARGRIKDTACLASGMTKFLSLRETIAAKDRQTAPKGKR